MKNFIEGLTFDDVLIMPKKSSIDSRSNVDTSTKICGHQLDLPVLSANMDTVTEENMAEAMDRYGGMGVIHRFADKDRREEMVDNIDAPIGVAIGLDDSLNFLERLWLNYTNIKFFVLDVAHGHQGQVIHKIKGLNRFRERTGSSIKLVAGNVATKSGAEDLSNAGADAVKVGVGPGSACTTRIKTGCGVPQFTAIREAASALRNRTTGLIADGGIRKPADIVKAIAAGADAVMIGGWFAGTDETPDPTRFRGMASRQASQENGKSFYTSEGVAVDVEPKGSVERILRDIEGGLRSGMSYVGARTLYELKRRKRFVRVTRAGQVENETVNWRDQ